jgi:hypothetical protein
MKLFRAFLIIISLAEVIFTLVYFLIKRKPDRILFLGLGIYLLVLLSGYIAFKISIYNKKKRNLLNALTKDMREV